jgi:phosphoribosylamine---glycine ligase
VLASPGYPDAPQTGTRIVGLGQAEDSGALVFHAGTALLDGELVSAGGRVLAVTALGDDPDGARARAYAAVEAIDFPGSHFRRDIAENGSRVPS